MGNESTDAERLTRVETKLDSIEAFLLRLDGKLDAYQTNYVPRVEINEMFRSRDALIDELRESQRETPTRWREWIAVIIAAGAFIYSIIQPTS